MKFSSGATPNCGKYEIIQYSNLKFLYTMFTDNIIGIDAETQAISYPVSLKFNLSRVLQTHVSILCQTRKSA